MNLDDLHITRDDFEFLRELESYEKIEFLWDCQFVHKEYSLTSGLEEMEEEIEIDLEENLESLTDHNHMVAYEEYYDFTTRSRLVLSMYNGRLHVNCTSLKLLRAWIFKMVMNDGVILEQVKDAKKEEDDIYRYYKCYTIIGRANPICPN